MKRKKTSETIFATAKFIIVATIVVFLIVTLPISCTRPDEATELLKKQGYTDIHITGWRPMMAGKDESISTGFEATSPNGQQISGAVTSGFLFKGQTIRFD